MATSSITHHFCITAPQSIDRFIHAIDEAERNNAKAPLSLNGKLLTSQNEIAAFMKRRSQNDKSI